MFSFQQKTGSYAKYGSFAEEINRGSINFGLLINCLKYAHRAKGIQ